MIANRVGSDQLAAIRAALADLPDMVVAAVAGEPGPVRADLPGAGRGGGRRAGAGQRVLAGPRVTGPDRGGDEPAQRAGPARPDVAVIAPSDRTDLIPGLMMAHQSGTFPPLAGILLTGGYAIPETDPPAVRGRAAGPADRADRRWARSPPPNG